MLKWGLCNLYHKKAQSDKNHTFKKEYMILIRSAGLYNKNVLLINKLSHDEKDISLCLF